MKDNIKAFKGHFKLEEISKDGSSRVIVDDKNLIVNNASEMMAKIVGGYYHSSTAPDIDKFLLGAGGHNPSNPLQIRAGWPDPTVTELYDSEYEISFTPPNGTGESSLIIDTSTPESGNDVSMTTVGNIVTFTIIISEANANIPEGGYSEAALFMGNEIFAMKCFPFKQKDENTEWKITWALTF